MIKHQEILKKFPSPDPQDIAVELLADRYHRDTEMFDRTLPGNWSEHEPLCWIPRGTVARGASFRFAKKRFEELSKEAREKGISERRFARVLRNWKISLPRDYKP